ncbi:protein O-linked-mannose beta-1,2-N-acetylglucosaminyltransferase 1-like [Clytia hemisphaerica]|uniref:Alpha-1,3-mannosyl-glycoprotein 2-beta-N-acetylglucosaminyltransferase n=1 Tax=Clytia hemisphaerica TaxID=252671 RepID=A0A7M5VC85_9CNID|eukprot:TCONS_00025511-protein
MWKLSRRRWSTNQIILIVLFIIICNIIFLTHYPIPNQPQQDGENSFPWGNKDTLPWRNKQNRDDLIVKRNEGRQKYELEEMKIPKQRKNQFHLRNQKIQKPNNQGEIRTIKIEAMSSKDRVYINIDGFPTYDITTDADRGVHMVILNQVTGVVMAKRAFDTYLDHQEEDMVKFLQNVRDGRIIVCMIKDEGSQRLTNIGRQSLKKTLSSKHADDIQWRSTWVLIATKNKKWFAENVQNTKTSTDWARKAQIQTEVQLENEASTCDWGNDYISTRRQQFCYRYEGYGKVCNCENPDPIDLKGALLPGSRVDDLPIAVVAANRPYYLYRMLSRLLKTPGVNPKMVTVYIDGFLDEPKAISELFNVAVVEHSPICSKNCRISQHYKRLLRETFDKYTKSNYMIILEEDLDVAVDIMDYFSQMLPVLEKDQSLYCVSAWNDQGYEHSSKDPSLLYRMETMPGLGWVLKRKIFEELEPKWPGTNTYWDWDMWMRMNVNRKDRECIVPDVPRTFHFGSKGLNVNPYFQSIHFNNRRLNNQSGIKFDVSKVTKDGYEEEVNRRIKQATVLDHSKNPCTNKDFIPDTKDQTYVFYIAQKHAKDFETWNSVASCFKLWDLDTRGFHNQMFRFWRKENHIFVVGISSVYAKHKPKDVQPIFISNKQKNQY